MLPVAILTRVGAVAAFAAAAALAGEPARADLTGDLRPGQTFAGDCPAGETIRLKVDLVQGALLRMQIALKVASVDQYLPANFQRIAVYGPDGKPVAFDRTFADARYLPKARLSTFYIRDWPVPASGTYTFAVSHLTRVATKCSGKVSTVRTTRVPFSGDETNATFSLPLAPDDVTTVTVRKVSGSAPFVAGYLQSGDIEYEPRQKRTKKGATSKAIGAFAFATATYRIGYQDDTAPTGAFTGTIFVRPYARYGRAALSIANPPGVPVTIRDVSAFVDAPFAVSGAGVASDGTNVLVTGENNGQVIARYYDMNLVDVNPLGQSRLLANAGDLPTGQTLRGHRLAYSNGFYYVAFSSTAGTSAALSRFPATLARSGFTSIVDGSSDPTGDLFLTVTDSTVSVGMPRPPYGHTVYQYVADATLRSVGTPLLIGGASWPQAPGSSAVWRTDQGVYEMWSPDSIVYGAPSDLHHVIYSPSWGAITTDSKPVADPNVSETFCTSVVLDADTGATIVHWVEPSNALTGQGRLHRVLFDAIGVEIPNSRATLGNVERNRPAAFISGNALYVAAEGPSGAVVTKYSLLRN